MVYEDEGEEGGGGEEEGVEETTISAEWQSTTEEVHCIRRRRPGRVLGEGHLRKTGEGQPMRSLISSLRLPSLECQNALNGRDACSVTS